MADFAEEASEASEKYLRAILARRIRLAAGDSATECAHCGEIIPEARRKAMPGCVLCVGCQQEEERCAN